jgi:hypothetical protein
LILKVAWHPSDLALGVQTDSGGGVVGVRLWAVLLIALLAAPAPVPCQVVRQTRKTEVAWQDLAGLVEGRVIEAVLRSGVHVKGKAKKVLPEAMEIQIERTTDAGVVPLGLARIPRESVPGLSVKKDEGPMGALLGMAGVVAGFFLAVATFVAHEDGWGSGKLLIVTATQITGPAVAGYILGSRLDQKWTYVAIVPDARGEKGKAVER